jgi:hypothetical protein
MSTAQKCLLFCLLCFKGFKVLAVLETFSDPPAGDHGPLRVYIVWSDFLGFEVLETR